MVTNRTPVNRPLIARITPEVIALYYKVLALQDDQNNVDMWEDDGGKRRKYLDTCHALHSALGRKPWQETISGTIGDDVPPDWTLGADKIKDWNDAKAVRIEIERAMAAGHNLLP